MLLNSTYCAFYFQVKLDVVGEEVLMKESDLGVAASTTVGLCRLNQVDPYPITYGLSNP